ncbi:tRNA epoxyqueuosine(34) reductase QueG [Pendulispora albinea]|uniref:tRNA epoxyqueuosine(34) reductase QueG n=1 Tax=Pendulispora albinea TaxID=2741071 RepID=A0ABZ2LJX2_9BACT
MVPLPSPKKQGARASSHGGALSAPPAPPAPARASAEEAIVARARMLGFDAVGFARADLPVEADFEHYRAFIDQGMHGEMGWLAENAEVRASASGEGILAGARTVICLARRYQRPREEEENDAPLARTVARYARGSDYHNHLRRKLRKLATFVRGLGSPEEPVSARPICDDAPMLERAWAARAGLGFVGKNGLLIVPGQGSMVLLGEVVTTLALTPGVPMAERCGSCTRCLEACPTGAFVRPFVLDPRRCIAYLTIEHRSGIAEEFRGPIGEHLFGCDDCQTVCPFNASTRPRKPDPLRVAAVAAGRPQHAEDLPGSPFEPLECWRSLELAALLELREPEPGAAQVEQDAQVEPAAPETSDDPSRALWTKLAGSPVRRATADGLARNAALVLGNRGDAGALPALRRAAVAHPAEMVRTSAAWAVRRIEGMLG